MSRTSPSPEAMNYYVALGIDEDADPETIRRAFRGLVRRYHPDAGKGSSPEAFRRVVEAYETLNDPARRRAYDRTVQRERARRTVPPSVPRIVEPLGNRMTISTSASTDRLSPDGSRVAQGIYEQNTDVWIWDLRRKAVPNILRQAADGTTLFDDQGRSAGGTGIDFRASHGRVLNWIQELQQRVPTK